MNGTWWQFSRVLHGGMYWLEKYISAVYFLDKNVIKVRFRNKTLCPKSKKEYIK